MSKPIRCVYVAGAYSADNVMGLIDNIRRGMRLCAEVWKAGFAYYCPWADFQIHLMLDQEHADRLTVQDGYAASMAWLERSDAMLIGDWAACGNSKGLHLEIRRCHELGIPVFESLDALKQAALLEDLKEAVRA